MGKTFFDDRPWLSYENFLLKLINFSQIIQILLDMSSYVIEKYTEHYFPNIKQ